MNRKLHNSLNAAMACSALLTLAVLAGAPIEQASPAEASIAAIASTPASTTVAAEPAAAVAASSDHRMARRSYHSVRMPFFSFFLPQG